MATLPLSMAEFHPGGNPSAVLRSRESWAIGQTIACWPSVVISTFPGEGCLAHWGVKDLVPLFVGIFCNPERPDLEVKEWKNIDLGFQAQLFCTHLSSLGPK